MERWSSFKLSYQDYLEVLLLWELEYPNTEIDSLNTGNWSDWIQEILEL